MDYFLLWFQFSRRIAAETLATKARMRAKQLSMASIARVIWLCARVRYCLNILYWRLDTRYEAHSSSFSFLCLSLPFFLAPSQPFLSSLPFFSSRTRHRGCRAKARRRARNILAQLCFAPDDSQHYRSLGVDASFLSPYPGISILLYILYILPLLPFSF